MNIAPRATGKVGKREGRHDPAPRPVQGTKESFSSVKNGDPSRSYVLQYLADEDGFTSRVENGWIVEKFREGGPMVGPAMNVREQRAYKEGEMITYRGHVLMSIDKQSLKEQRRYGSLNGQDLGEVYFDQLEERILDRGGQDSHDPMRGSRFMRVVNEIGANEVELDV